MKNVQAHMQRIKLDATDSTNAYLKKLLLSEKLEDFTIVTANEQLSGREANGFRSGARFLRQ